MRVLGLVWLGVCTEAYTPMRHFRTGVLGLPVVQEERDFLVTALPDGAAVEVFGPASPYRREHFDTGPVAGFLVEDLDTAGEELRAAGIELLGEPGSAGDTAWAHFRAPDGNVYELTQGAGRTTA